MLVCFHKNMYVQFKKQLQAIVKIKHRIKRNNSLMPHEKIGEKGEGKRTLGKHCLL